MRKGFSLLELLAVLFVIAVTNMTWKIVAGSYGTAAGVVAGFIAIVVTPAPEPYLLC